MAALEHNKTTQLLKSVNNAGDIIIGKIKTRIASLTSPKDFNPTSFLANLNPNQKLFILTLHTYNVLIKMVQLIKPLAAEHESNLRSGNFKGISNKLIILMENHDDEGTYIFLDRYKKLFMESEYGLCLELPYNRKDYANEHRDVVRKSKFLQLAFNSEFSANLIIIDPCYDFLREDMIKLILDTYSKHFFCAETRIALRDKGMFLFICKAALKHNGKVVAPLGALHSMILNYLGAAEIPFAIASPFVEPSSLDLSKGEDGVFTPKPDANPGLTLLFRKFAVQPLHLVAGDDNPDPALDAFVKLNLRG